MVVDHRGQGRRDEGRGQGRSQTVGVPMGTVNARPARGSAVWTSPRPGLAKPALYPGKDPGTPGGEDRTG